MDKIRIGKTIYTRPSATDPWTKQDHASLRLARKANRGNFTPCLDKPSQLPAQQVDVPAAQPEATQPEQTT